MNSKKWTTIIVLVLAIGVASYVIYNEWRASQIAASNQKKIEEYLEDDPSVRVEEVPSGLTAGAMAPDVSLPMSDLEVMGKLSDYRGEFLIMNLWASWCPPCIDEMPDFVQFSEDYQGKGVQVIGVNLTTQETSLESVYQFIEDFQIPFPIALDLNGEVHEAYQAFSIPMTFILDPEGRIAVRHVGYLDYGILESLYQSAKQEWNEDL